MEDEPRQIVSWESKPILVNSQASLSLYQLHTEGNPSSPLDFPGPNSIGQAMRTYSNVLNPITFEVVSRRSIVYRIPSEKERPPLKAYCIINKLCDTTHGSIQICRVLQRGRRRTRDSSGNYSLYNSDGDILTKNKKEYEWNWITTDDLVILKVSWWSKIQRNRGRYLSDPVKEIGVTQYLGDYHDHVAGSIDIMSDDQHLYSFLPYYNGGCLYDNMMTSCRENNMFCLTEVEARKWFRQLLLVRNFISFTIFI